MMRLQVFTDVDAVARRAAETIAEEARAAVEARGLFTLAISGGRTPWVMLRMLSSLDVPWANVHVFQVDERIAPAGDPDRNLTHMRASLLDVPAAAAAQIHPMPVESTDLDAGISAMLRRWPASPAARRYSISFTSGWVLTDTPRRWCRATRSSTSRMPTWP